MWYGRCISHALISPCWKPAISLSRHGILQLELVEHIPRTLPEHAITMGIALCMSAHNHAVKVKTKMKMNTKMEIKLKIKMKSNKE